MMKTNILIFSILITFCCCFAFSADTTLTFATPEEAGISESILKEGVAILKKQSLKMNW